MSEESQIRSDIERSTKKGLKYMESDIKKAIRSLKSAHEKSLKLNNEAMTRTCAFRLGSAYVDNEQWEEGLKYLQEAMPPGNTKYGRSNGDLYYNIGLAHESIGNEKEAVQNLCTALEEYKSENDHSTFQMEAEVLEKLGKLYDKSEDKRAIDTYGELSVRYASLKKLDKQLDSLCEKAKRALKFKEIEETKKAVKDCRKLLTAGTRKDTSGKLYNELGLICIEVRMFDDARKCFEAALDIIGENSGETQLRASVLQNLGVSCKFVRDYEKAIQFTNDAAKTYAKLKDRQKQGHCFANLGSVFIKLGQLDKAKENFNHALLAADDTDDLRSQWQVQEALGDIHYYENKMKDAKEHFKNALKPAVKDSDDTSENLDRIVAKLESCWKPRKVNKIIRRQIQRKSPDPEDTAGSSEESEEFSPDTSESD